MSMSDLHDILLHNYIQYLMGCSELEVNLSFVPNFTLLFVTGLLKESAPSRVVVTASMAHNLMESLNPKVCVSTIV